MTNLDQFDDVDIISEELDKIYKRLNTLRKKSKLWGITDDEKIKLSELEEDYNELYFILLEAVFCQQIEAFIDNENISNIKAEMRSRYNWEGEILYNNEELVGLLSEINSIHSFLNLIDKLMKEELLSTKEFIKTDLGKEIEDAFASICMFEKADELDSISKYIITRNKVLKSLVETYFNPLN